MFARHLLFLSALAAAIFLPALIYNDSWTQNLAGDKPAAEPEQQRNPYGFASYGRNAVDLSPSSMGSSTIGSSAATVPVVVPREPFHINPASPEKSTLIPVRGLPVIPSTSGTMIPVNGTPLASIPPGQQTVVLPGDANGPDLNATPLEFMPIASLNEIVRFDVNPSWVKARWERVSTSPG